MAITPFLRAGRSVYYVSFRHPETRAQINRSLGTSDYTEARAIALDVERMTLNRDAWDISNPVLSNFLPAAVLAFHGRPAEIKTVAVDPVLVNGAQIAAGFAVEVTVENPQATADRATIASLRQTIFERDAEIAAIREDLRRYQRRFNAHIHATLGMAEAEWVADYSRDRAAQTINDAVQRVHEFVEFTGGSLKLGDLKGAHIDAWLETFRAERRVSIRRRRKTVEKILPPLHAQTIRRRKGCLSVFLTWCVKRYEMYGNPIEHTHELAGVQCTAESIVSIRRLDELYALLDGLEGYWRAVAAVGCLAGLRLAEICWLKRSDVYLSERYLRVTSRESVGGDLVATKTGRERNVPIERTRLLPILTEYMNGRQGDLETGRHGEKAWPWLFPSLVADQAWQPRVKTPPGLWCHGSNFGVHRKLAIEAARAKAPVALRDKAFWGYGPREWRHTCGTAMGLSGLSPLVIAKVLGNSPAVCERHYIGVRAEDAGLRWPFRWG